MFEDDVYDLPESSDLYYQLRKVAGGWRIVDLDEPERFKTVYANKTEAQDLCASLNKGQSAIERESDYDTDYD